MARGGITVERLRRALATVAALLIEDAAYAPIFERMEREVALAEANVDAITRARTIVANQRAMAETTL